MILEFLIIIIFIFLIYIYLKEKILSKHQEKKWFPPSIGKRVKVVDGINIHIQKLISYPIYLTVMTIFASVIMLNIKRNKSKLFHLALGILL